MPSDSDWAYPSMSDTVRSPSGVTPVPSIVLPISGRSGCTGSHRYRRSRRRGDAADRAERDLLVRSCPSIDILGIDAHRRHNGEWRFFYITLRSTLEGFMCARAQFLHAWRVVEFRELERETRGIG